MVRADVEKILLTAVVGLVASYIGFVLQQGGARRRMRSRLRDELALWKELDPASIVAQRLRARIDDLLQKYEPDPVMMRAALAWTWPRLAALAAWFVLAGAGSFFAVPSTLPQELEVLAIAACGLASGAGAGAILRYRIPT